MHKYLFSALGKSISPMSDKLYRFICSDRLSHILVWIPVNASANLELV